MTLPPTKLPPIPADGVQHEEKVCSCPVPSLHRFEPLPGAKFLPANTLTVGQERGLQDLAMQIRRENEDYLVEHPEVDIVSVASVNAQIRGPYSPDNNPVPLTLR